MRRAWILILVLAASPTLAFAGDDLDAAAAVEKLAAHLEKGDATFENTNDLYKAAKAALAHDEDGAAQARYEAIQDDVAAAMRRNDLPTSAWIMGVFGATLMWGGLAFCIGVARKKGGSGGKGNA